VGDSYNIHVHKAQPVGEQRVLSLVIYVQAALPAIRGAGELMQDDANRIVEALRTTLPQGTLDHILARLCAVKASELRVRQKDIGR